MLGTLPRCERGHVPRFVSLPADFRRRKCERPCTTVLVPSRNVITETDGRWARSRCFSVNVALPSACFPFVFSFPFFQLPIFLLALLFPHASSASSRCLSRGGPDVHEGRRLLRVRAQERRRGSSNRTSSVTHFVVGSEDNVFQLYVHGKLFPNPSFSLFFFLVLLRRMPHMPVRWNGRCSGYASRRHKAFALSARRPASIGGDRRRHQFTNASDETAPNR